MAKHGHRAGSIHIKSLERAAVSDKIRTLKREGMGQKQAVAVALNMAGHKKKKKKK